MFWVEGGFCEHDLPVVTHSSYSIPHPILRFRPVTSNKLKITACTDFFKHINYPTNSYTLTLGVCHKNKTLLQKENISKVHRLWLKWQNMSFKSPMFSMLQILLIKYTVEIKCTDIMYTPRTNNPLYLRNKVFYLYY